MSFADSVARFRREKSCPIFAKGAKYV